MHHESLSRWVHEHTFGQHKARPGETRTIFVAALTGVMMILEIIAGGAFGSMALLADGLHMASHAVALGIAAAAYVYARRHAADPRFSFGTGKVNSLSGFAGAILLGVFSVMMVWESLGHLLHPVPIVFDWAIAVAVIGLVVNGVSMVILGGSDHGDHHHPEKKSRGHHRARPAHPDHNLRSAYLHVLADALTSLLAIVALLAGKYLGAVWLDPAMGIVGAGLVARWSWGLLRSSGAVLLDRQAPEGVQGSIVGAIEDHSNDRVTDLHVWSVAPEAYAAEIALVTHDPKAPDHYKSKLPVDLGLAHVTVEVHRCPGPDGEV